MIVQTNKGQVNAELVKENSKTVIVKLHDGKTIKVSSSKVKEGYAKVVVPKAVPVEVPEELKAKLTEEVKEDIKEGLVKELKQEEVSIVEDTKSE
jgi:hypothetical protein